MRMACLFLAIYLGTFATASFAQTQDETARMVAANRFYDRLFPDEASLVAYLAPLMAAPGQAGPELIRFLTPEWTREAFVSSFAQTYTLPELRAYERFVATPEGLSAWRKTYPLELDLKERVRNRMMALWFKG